jgi:hypothetical protein
MTTEEPNPMERRVGYCEMCNTWGHHQTACPLLKKYQSMPMNLFCNVCKYIEINENYFHEFDLMGEHT